MDIDNKPVVDEELQTQVVKPVRSAFPSALVLGVVIGLLLTSTGVFAALYFNVIAFPGKQNQTEPSVLPQTSPSQKTEVKPSPALDQVVWNSKPVAVNTLSLFKPRTQIDSEYSYLMVDKAKYDDLGKNSKGQTLVRVMVPIDGPAEYDMTFYCLTDKTQIICLNNGLSEWDIEAVDHALKDEIGLSNETVMGVTVPDTLLVKGVVHKLGDRVGLTVDEMDDKTLIEKNDFGSTYQSLGRIGETSLLRTKIIYLELKDQSLFTYTLAKKPFPDTKRLQPSWIDGLNKENSFGQNLVPGCGGGMYAAKPIYVGPTSNKQVVAKSQTGENLYQLESTDILKDLYQIYTIGREGFEGVLSQEDFVATKDVYLLYQDDFGDWQVFLNDFYAPPVECGKPVVYLYPTTKMPIHVAVGADVAKSEPIYPKNGWDVVAEPSGKLLVGDKHYPNLFWEGKGKGLYPDYRDQGVIVDQQNLLAVLKNQLTTLGLNQTETNDFLEFWQPRLPKTKYIRLTWLGTRDMDRLAPLTVYPKPDTMIRIFLEFEGLDRVKTLKPQRLDAVDRKGFTLVEWGGLLIGE